MVCRLAQALLSALSMLSLKKKTGLLLGKELSSMELTLGLPNWQSSLFGMVIVIA